MVGREASGKRTVEVIERELATVSGHIDAAEHTRMTLIRELDELDVGLGENLSLAQWLSWRIGLSPGAARERVRVARALGKLPRIDEAMKHGRLSYSKVRAITRVATPENEERLLAQALIMSAAQLEKLCRRVSRVQRQRGEAGPTEGDRYVVMRETEDGMVLILAKMFPDEGAQVMKALEAAQKDGLEREKRARDVSAETPEGAEAEPPRRPCRADALLEICERYLATDPQGERRPPAERHQILIAMTPSMLLEKTQQIALEDGTRVSAETFRRLACDAGLIAAAVDEKGNPLDVGRKRRTIPPALRRALLIRDGGTCRFPGCNCRVDLEGHHAESWLDGGATSLSNLLLLCRRHHRLLHEGGYRVEVAQDGGFVFRDRQGRVLEPSPQREALPEDATERLKRMHAAGGIRIDDQTCMPGWDGTPVDYDCCVDAIVGPEPERSGRQRVASSGTTS